MTTVTDLVPGDLTAGSVFVAQCPHPIWPHLRLVIWQLADGSWSLDALDPRQDVGRVELSTPEQRMDRLRAALLGQVPAPGSRPPGFPAEKWSVMSRRERREEIRAAGRGQRRGARRG
ncbi:MAG TPA: hypothetical protein VF163_02455 [Micromonosporaceae bacterium]